MYVHRYCARCQRELTDAASRDRGVGPICRKLDNYVLATQLPADREVAQQCFAEIDRLGFPDVARVVIGKIEAELASTGNRRDWRSCVTRLEWLLSFSPARHAVSTIVDTVEALGYAGLASVWLGEACKSEAIVWLKGDRLYVAAKRNRSGAHAFKAIRGRRFHKAAELQAENSAGGWSVPASAFSEFKLAVIRHYPRHEVEWNVLEKATAGAKSEPLPPL